MYGHQAGPTRVYAYGARTPHEGLDALRDEEREIHRLRNALIAVERERRERAAAVMLAHAPDIAATLDQISAIDEEIERLRAEVRRRNSAERRRRPQDDPATPRIRALREQRLALTGRHDREDPDACTCLACRRRSAYATPEVKAALAEVEAAARQAAKALYAERTVSWANYNAVAQSIPRSGPPPRFVPWGVASQRGRIVVQIQRGATWQQLLDGYRGVQVVPLPLPPGAKPGGRRSRRPLHELRIRVGRDARGDDRSRPVAVRFALHRPIPADARVQQVWLVRRRVGTHDEWSVQFVVTRSAGWARQDTHTAAGACGVDLRWRQQDDGSLVVAHVEGEDGWRETLVVPARRLGALRHADSLRAIRDREFDAARAVLAQWLTEHDVPDWIREATATLAQWRSPARLAALVLRWRDERYDGDATIYERLEEWRRQDKHLYDWEAAERRAFARWRQDLYRRFAARLRWRYQTVVVEDVDWRELLRRPPAEEAEEPERLNRSWYARAAAPGLLRQTIEQSVEDTRHVDAAHTSRRCAECGAEPAPDWDAATEQTYRCAAGHAAPAWVNAARNLLAAASGEVVRE